VQRKYAEPYDGGRSGGEGYPSTEVLWLQTDIRFHGGEKQRGSNGNSLMLFSPALQLGASHKRSQLLCCLPQGNCVNDDITLQCRALMWAPWR